MAVNEAATTSQLPADKPTVLIVEDEMMLRMRAVDIVEDAGYTPLEAVNAAERPALLESRSDIQLLFTDIQMPGTMDGLKLAFVVRERWPSIKIILVSGQVSPTSGERPSDSRFFGKPLGAAHMIAELQDMRTTGQGHVKILPGDILIPTPSQTPPHKKPNGKPAQTSQALTAENDSLRLLLEQASIDAKAIISQAGIDAKEREAADKLQKLILEELHHRIKILWRPWAPSFRKVCARQSASSMGKRRLRDDLRLWAARTHLLLQASWAHASLTQTIRSATAAYDSEGSGKFVIHGPEINITSAAVIALAMTLNELCTNTTKFGALSVPGGRVEITWNIEQEGRRLKLRWTETGGPPVQAPTRKSFGTRLVATLGQQLMGEAQLSYHSTGFEYVLDVPVPSEK